LVIEKKLLDLSSYIKDPKLNLHVKKEFSDLLCKIVLMLVLILLLS